jgi:hypothetical protein
MTPTVNDSFKFRSPYLPLDRPARWLKGNHHGHSTLSDGVDSPEANVDAYDAAGYDYFALSEHDRFCDPAAYSARTGMVLLPAVEVTSDLDQTLMYLGATADLPGKGTQSLRGVLAFVQARGGLFICDHPNWLYRPDRLHAPVEDLLAIESLPAIEIYTGVIERLRGNPYSLDVWDRLLSAGRRVFGHATDDQHGNVDRFLGWNCVQWPSGSEPTPEGIIAALAAGRFVASTGVAISSIGIADDGAVISVESNALFIRWIVAGGILAEVTEGGSGSLSLTDIPSLDRVAWSRFSNPGDARYVRVECVGDRGTMAWSQPFFIEPRRQVTETP